MAVSIKSEDGRISITADDGSTVKNIRVDGKDVVGGNASGWEVTKRAAVYLAMIVFCLGFWALVFVGCSKLAHASPLDCEQIRDGDQRHYCRAVSIPRKSECEFIKSHDLRQECRAKVSK